MRVEGRKVSDMARLIRKKKYESEWDSIVHTDKQFKSLSRIFAEALKRVGAEFGINLDQLESMSHNKAENFSKESIHQCLQHVVRKLDQNRIRWKMIFFSTSKTFRRRINEL